MIIAIISIIFVLIVVSAIFLPMIFHSQKLKAACNTDTDCANGSKCVLDPNTKKKTCIPESKKFCSMFENNLSPCNLETDSVCAECETGPNDLNWSCQSSLWDTENNKARSPCKPSSISSPSLKPCSDPGPGGICVDGCSKGEICIRPSPSGGALGPTNSENGRCSLPRTWHKSKLLCDKKGDSECETKCKNVFGEWENNKCIVFKETVVPPGSVHPIDNKGCKKDSDCNAKNGELCAGGECAQVQGWCQIPLQKSDNCNEYTGTYTLKQSTDVNGKTEYEWACLCDTNLFDKGTEGSSCVNLTGCQGQNQNPEGDEKVYIPEIDNDEKKKSCVNTNKCGDGSICINDYCHIPWEGETIMNSRSPYPCTNDGTSCGYGVQNKPGSVCNCGTNVETKVVNLLPESSDSKRWFMYCDGTDSCSISGGKHQDGGCICNWPLMNDPDNNNKSCKPDLCVPGYTISSGNDKGLCFCPNNNIDNSKVSQYGPNPIGGGSWQHWSKGDENFYPYLADEGQTCSPICEDNPCGNNGTCRPKKGISGTYYKSCKCHCGTAGEFCQYSADNKLSTNTLCSIEDGAPLCCGSSPGASPDSPENPCVVGRLSPFVRAGLSDRERDLDNNPSSDHEGYKLGFCYKPCGLVGPGGVIDNTKTDQSLCLDPDETCTLLPRNAYNFTQQTDTKKYAYCTKNIPDFDNSNHPKAGPSCYANSFNNDFCVPSPSSNKNTCASFYLDGSMPAVHKKSKSSLCCFNNPRLERTNSWNTGSAETLPTCLYDCPGIRFMGGQSDCENTLFSPFWNDEYQ